MTREEHCTHPNQAWCDCDWCRLVRAQAKPTEELVGANRGITHQIVDRQHVGSGCLAVVRIVRRKLAHQWPEIPRPLKRGVILACLLRHKANRALYSDVMS